MKKRIISLILVLALSLIALVGCGYSYDKDDLTKYATFNKDNAFINALASLVIEDADFGTDQAKRQEKVLDKIFAELATAVKDELKAADEDEATALKKLLGTPGKYDLYNYCYYMTFDKEGETIYLSTDKLKEASATEIQLGLSSLADLNKKIAEALAASNLAEGGAFKTDTSKDSKTEAGQTIVISYKETYQVTTDEGVTSKETNTVSGLIVTLPAAANTDAATATILDKLIDVAVGTKANYLVFRDVNGDGTVNTEDAANNPDRVDYTDLTIDYIVKSGMNASYESGIYVTDTTYTEDKTVKDVFGKEHNLKDVSLTYHIFPVYYLEVANELNGTLILDKLIGSGVVAADDKNSDGTIGDDETKGSFDVFVDAGYKNGEETINALVTRLVELYKTLAEKETALTTAEDALKKDAENQEKKDAVTTAEADVTTAEADVDAQIAKIVACTKDGETKTAGDVIADEYKKTTYDSLETAYKSAIKKALATEIFALMSENIEYKLTEDGKGWNLPRSEVNEAYKTILNNYKYTYYTTSSLIEKYKNAGGFNKFLIEDKEKGLGLGTGATEQDIKDAIGKKAEKAVQEKILVYMFTNAVEAAFNKDLTVTEEEKKTHRDNVGALQLIYQSYGLNYPLPDNGYEDKHFLAGLQFDKTMNFLLTETEKEDNDTDLTVKYDNVQYTFKAEE